MMLVQNIEKCLSLQPNKCGCGVIGSRARLRIWCREAWGFESLHPHKQNKSLNSGSCIIAQTKLTAIISSKY